MTNKEDEHKFFLFADDPEEGSRSSEEEEPCISSGSLGSSLTRRSPFSENIVDEKKARRSFSGGGGTAGHVSANEPYSSNANKGNPFSSFSFNAGDYSDESLKNTSFVFTARSGCGSSSANGSGSGGGMGRGSGSVAVERDSNDTPFVPEEGFYQPSSEETTEAYQALVSLISFYSIGAPEAVLYSFADEVLSVLKNSYITDPAVKKAKINEFLKGSIPDFLFNQMVTTASLIKDYPWYESDRNFYQPKSVATSMAYVELLDVVNGALTYPLPELVKRVTVNEVLRIMKDPELNIARKREEVEDSFLGRISDEDFDHLLYGSTVIDDFNDDLPRSNFLVPQGPIQLRPETIGFNIVQSRGGDQLEVDVKSTSDSSCDDLLSTKSEAGTVFRTESDEESDQAGELVYDRASDEDEEVVSDNEEAEGKFVYSEDEGDAVDEDKGAENNNEESGGKSVYNDHESDAVNEDKEAAYNNEESEANSVYSDDESQDKEAANNNEESEDKIVYSDEDAEAEVSGPKHKEEIEAAGGNKLEYSSEEESLYLEVIQASDSDKEVEDGWVKIN